MLKTTQTTIAEKVRHRLEQLDDYDEGSVHHMQNLTQQEYVHKIEMLNQELVQAWNTDQRVKALKIAIQCAKLLADTSVMQFYPSQFILVTDILDNFGRLVFERLRTKAEYFKYWLLCRLFFGYCVLAFIVFEQAWQQCGHPVAGELYAGHGADASQRDVRKLVLQDSLNP